MLLHDSTALRDLDRSFKLLNTRKDLLIAAYPNLGSIELGLLRDELKLAAHIDQLINIFETQGWASFNKEPAPDIFTVELLPTTELAAKQVLLNLEFVLGQTTLRAFCPNSAMSITVWGHAPTVLNRIGMFPSLAKDWNWPMTVAKLIKAQEQSSDDIIEILGGPRSALDLLMY